jgi:hypothetical protein
MSSIVNQNQGGGSKKAGFPYQIGRGSYSSVFLGENRQSLHTMSMTMLKQPPHQNIPVGFGHNIRMR